MKAPLPPPATRRHAEQGALSAELLVALGLLTFTLLPLSFSFQREQQTLRGLYGRAIAIEIVDGEMEILRAGLGTSFPPGVHPYEVRADAARNLPPGEFRLHRETNTLRLEWRPAGKGSGGPVSREIILAETPAPAAPVPPPPPEPAPPVAPTETDGGHP